jgi:phytoene/squalene synthetase
LPIEHYENFPVASLLVPARMRAPIEAIYGFARGADDVADEGDAPDAERLAQLDGYLRALDAIEAGRAPPAEFARIAEAIRTHDLPIQLLRDLIDAFKQDVVKKRYADFAELLDYSRRSANPVGRLVLHIFEKSADEKTGDRPRFSAPRNIGVRPRFSVEQSDLICSALQLINFWQDVAVDWQKGRVYIPQEDLARFGVSESDIERGNASEKWRELMAFECARARRMLAEGSPLGRELPGRLGLEIRATIAGGAAILDRIDAVRGDVFLHRPKLNKADWIKITGKLVSETIFRPMKNRL